MPISTKPASDSTLRLTKQNALFPRRLHSFSEEQYEQTKRGIAQQTFDIRDDLLYACVTYGDGLASPSVTGFTNCKALGYALLTFFAQKALGLYRLPFCPDRIYERPIPRLEKGPYLEILDQLSCERIERICEELRALYQHTQRQLAAHGLTHVRLRRCVDDNKGPFNQDTGYAELMAKLAWACQLAGRTHLKVEMDVLNSYGDDGAYAYFPVEIVHTLPVEDILYCSNLIQSRKTRWDGSPRAAVEEGEWVVINRSPTGLVDLPVDCIGFNTNKWRDTIQPLLPTDPTKAGQFLEHFEPIVLRTSWASRNYYPYSALGALKMKPTTRLQVALHVLIKGRFPR